MLTIPVSESEIEAEAEQQTEREAVEASLAEVERKESEDKDAEKTQQEDERKVRESGEARLAGGKWKERGLWDRGDLGPDRPRASPSCHWMHRTGDEKFRAASAVPLSIRAVPCVVPCPHLVHAMVRSTLSHRT